MSIQMGNIGIEGTPFSDRPIGQTSIDNSTWRRSTCCCACLAGGLEPLELENSIFLVGTLWLFNMAMENGPFIDGLPIKNGDFPWLC